MAETPSPAADSPARPVTDSPSRSLRAATNPQARMQELLKRDSLPPPAEVLPETPLDSSAVGSATSSEDTQATSSAVAQKDDNAEPDSGQPVFPTQKSKNPPSKRKPNRNQKATAQTTSSAVAQNSSSADSSAIGSDPVRQAMLGMLALPYPQDMHEGLMTVTSVKIPKPIWERLEYARALTKKDKQDIIADALRIYFDLIVEDELEK